VRWCVLLLLLLQSSASAWWGSLPWHDAQRLLEAQDDWTDWL